MFAMEFIQHAKSKAKGVAMTATIYHNPECGTSRNALAIIRQSGEEPEIIEYLLHPPSRERLLELLSQLGMRPRELIRQKDTPYDELGLDDEHLSDETLIDAMVTHPILVNRPIVIGPRGTRLCRPSEVVLEVLSDPDIGPFTKEDGQVILAGNAPIPARRDR